MTFHQHASQAIRATRYNLNDEGRWDIPFALFLLVSWPLGPVFWLALAIRDDMRRA